MPNRPGKSSKLGRVEGYYSYYTILGDMRLFSEADQIPMQGSILHPGNKSLIPLASQS